MVNTSKVAGHMVVKNEDQWVWFAITSVLPYVDRLYITDTGSQDNTVYIIKHIRSPKIIFSQVDASSRQAISRVRQQQIEETQEDWIWCIDGDEVYPEATAREVVKAMHKGIYEGVTVRRYDLLGDIYHRQRESVGEYRMFGTHGHMVLRCMNKKRIKGLHVQGEYPMEGYYDGTGRAVLDHDPSLHYITSGYLYHAMYLKRSSEGSRITTMVNRSKYKIETGISVTSQPPEVFNLPRPSLVPDPYHKRSLAYELGAAVITPVKNLKRKII